MAQFDVYSTSVENIISWIKSGDRFFGMPRKCIIT